MTDEIMQMDEDAKWRADGAKHGWALPRKAAWPLRVWGVRFVRAAWYDYKIHKWASEFATAGIGLGPPNQRDIWVVYAIARGWC